MKIKILVLNLFEGGTFFENIENFIAEEKPDILLLQEVHGGHDTKRERQFRTIDELKKLLPKFHYCFAPTFMNNYPEFKVEQGNAIFSKFPMKAQPTIFYDTPHDPDYVPVIEKFPFTPRNLQHVTIELEGKPIHILNTQGIWGLDGGDSERRLKMSQIIVKEIKDKERVILGGDFNVKPDTETIRNVEKQLKNVFKNELKTSFNMKHKSLPGYATAVVDMLFVSWPMKVLDHTCPAVDVSDHLPLVATITI